MRSAKRVLWSSFDQGLSSVSNLLLSVLVARAAGVAEFGIFGLVFAIYQLGLGSSRAFLGEPALIRISKDPRTVHASGMLGASLALGLAGFLVCALAGFIAGPQGVLFFIFAVGFPVLMATDSCRYWLFAHGRPRDAAMVDLTWLLAQLGAYGVCVALGFNGANVVVSTWLFGALTALVGFMVVKRASIDLRAGWAWLKSARDLSFRFWGEYLTISGSQQSIVYFSVLFSGLGASAALRAGQVVVGPLSMVSMGVSVVALPELSRVAATGNRVRLVRRAALISAALLASTLVYSVAVMVTPEGVGEALLGESWRSGLALVPLLLALTAVSNVAYGATAALRALEKARLTLRLRLITLPVSLAAIFVGAAMSPAGAVIGAIIGAGVQMLLWWITLLTVTKRERGTSDE